MFMSPVTPNKIKNANINRIFVIIPAAGLSTRMESDENKQVMEIDGSTVIERTLGAFQTFSDNLAPAGITIRAVVVTSDQLVYRVNGMVRYNKFDFVQAVITGGSSRMESVWKGIEALADLPFPPNDNDIVFIHDGARCLVDQPTLERCLEGALQYDICAAAVPVKSTIKQTRIDTAEEAPRTRVAPRSAAASASLAQDDDIFSSIPTVGKEEPEIPADEAVEETVEEPVEEVREDPTPAAPTFSSLTELMESRRLGANNPNIAATPSAPSPFTPYKAPEPEPEINPFEAPKNYDDGDIRLEKFVSRPADELTPQKKPMLGLGMDYISKLPSLAERLGGAVMNAANKEELRRAAADLVKKEKEEAEKPKVEPKKPYVRPDSPFKRIDISTINPDEEPARPVEPEEEVAKEEPEVPNNSPFKRYDPPKETAAPVQNQNRPVNQRPPVKRQAGAVRPGERPANAPASRPAARPAATRPAVNRPAAATRPAARPAATRPAATRPAANASPFKSPEVVSTPARDELMEVQTPQVFRFDKLIKSYVNGIQNNIEATDDTSLAEAIHLKVHLVEGSYSNIKITTKEDIDYAELILKRQAAESGN